MDRPSGQPRWRPGPLVMSTLLLGGLTTLWLGASWAGIGAGAMLGALGDCLWAGSWAWPLAAALTLAVLTSPPAQQRWAQTAHRIPAAIGIFAGLVVLTSLAVSRPGLVLLVVCVVAGVGLLAALILVLPGRLVPPVPKVVLSLLSDHRARLEVADARIKLQNDVRTTALQTIAGLAVLAGAILAFQQLTEDRQQATATQELTRQGQASERFTRAIDQLGSDRREVQLGGIYGLEQVARQAPDNRLAVSEVLVAYLHRRVPRPAKPPPGPSSVDDLRIRAPDIQAILTVLGRRQIAPTDPPLDLRALDLRSADLSGVDLRDVDLSNANLDGADLSYAILREADLGEASLRRANLDSADLRSVDFRGADLRDAFVGFVDLSGATLDNADLRAADLGFAQGSGVL